MLTLEEYRERKRIEEEIYNELNAGQFLGKTVGPAINTGARMAGNLASSVGRGVGSAVSGVKQGIGNVASAVKGAATDFSQGVKTGYNQPTQKITKKDFQAKVPSIKNYLTLAQNINAANKQLNADIQNLFNTMK